MMYRQCEIRRNETTQIAWLPERYAKKGKVLRIRDEEGWLVVAVYAAEPEERVKARERGYTKWRSVTDV